MKRKMYVFAIVLLSLSLFSLVGCGSSSETTALIQPLVAKNDAPTTESPTPTTAEQTTTASTAEVTTKTQVTTTTAKPTTAATTTKITTKATTAATTAKPTTIATTKTTTVATTNTPPVVTMTATSPAGTTYVLNINSMKFHYPNCYAAKKILPENRQDVTLTREEIISNGFDPCGICDP